MRLYSNKESLANQEVSLLAIIETLLAVSCSFAIAAVTGNLWFIAMSSFFGWTLLLRTPASTSMGIEFFEWYLAHFYEPPRPNDKPPIRWPWRYVFVVSTMPIAALDIKMLATVLAASAAPIHTLKAVPQNWLRAIVSLDMASPLELIPGYVDHVLSRRPDPQGIVDVRYSTLRGELRSAQVWRNLLALLLVVGLFGVMCISALWPPRDSWFELLTLAFFVLLLSPIVALCVAATPLRLILYLPAIAYRLSLKATAVAYFPLLWLIQQTTSAVPIQAQLEYVRSGAYSRVKRVVAWACLTLFIGKVIAFSVEIKLSELWASSPLAPFFEAYVAPSTIPLWQWATFINAAIAILYFWLADFLLWRVKNAQYLDLRMTKIGHRAVLATCGVLSLYTMSANLWIIAHHRHFIHIPGVGRWWPGV
jgi:hypothetical protein